MTSRHILIIQGHPDRRGNRFGHALADAYAAGAREAGHRVEVVDVARISFPLLQSQDDWMSGEVPPDVRRAQDQIRAAQHLVIFFPLWLGTMPALLKAFFEQAFRPGFAVAKSKDMGMWQKLLAGRSARVVVTMGMPAFVYRWFFRAHAVRGLERNILHFCGITPVRETLIGMVEGDVRAREKRLAQLRELGREAR